MDKATIQKLDALNARFYKKVAGDFNETRSFYWHGWREFLPYLQLLIAEKESLSVVDIGCGNGRFGKFLYDYMPAVPIFYHGIDNNKELLDIAAKKLAQTHLDVQLEQANIVKLLLDNSFTSSVTQQYDVVTLFGVMHHVPSLKLRKKLMAQLDKILNPRGIVIITLWRFLDSKKLKQKIEPFDRLSLDQKQMQKHDYLLSWQRGSTAYRYCHYTDFAEEKELIKASNLFLIDSFESDGKEGRGNKYIILSNEKIKEKIEEKTTV